MVSADHDEWDPQVGEFFEDPFEQVYRVQRRDGTVEDIARDDHSFDMFAPHCFQQVFQKGALLSQQ